MAGEWKAKANKTVGARKTVKKMANDGAAGAGATTVARMGARVVMIEKMMARRDTAKPRKTMEVMANSIFLFTSLNNTYISKNPSMNSNPTAIMLCAYVVMFTALSRK